MKHEIKPGALVLLKAGGENPDSFPFVGQIHTVGVQADPWVIQAMGGTGRFWRFEPPLVSQGGREMTWGEDRLQVLDNPGDDEIDVHSFRKPAKSPYPAHFNCRCVPLKISAPD